MKSIVKFADKPFPHTPIASGAQRYTGDLKGEVLWCECKPNAEAPLGRFGIHIVSRVVIIPLEEQQPAQLGGKKAA